MATRDETPTQPCRIDIPPQVSPAARRRKRPTVLAPRNLPPAAPPAPTIRDSPGRFQALLDSIYDAVFITDLSGAIAEANLRAQAVFERTLSQLAGQSIGSLVSGCDSRIFSEVLDNLRAYPHVMITASCLAPDGSIFPVEIIAHFLDASAPTEIAFFVRDISDRVETDDRLRKALRLKSLHLLAGGLAHEFRNLLTSVIGHLELAIPVTPARTGVREDLSTALKDARRMGDLSGRMLAYAGRGVLRRDSVNLTLAVQEALIRLEEVTPANVLVRFTPPAAPVLAGGELDLLVTMAENLILNAVEAVGQASGSVRVTLSTRIIDEAFIAQESLRGDLQPGPHVCLEVSDTGYGMDEKVVGCVFDPFFSTKGAGRGLGLPEVQGIVVAHGGAILVKTRISEGATFTVLLPAWRPEAAKPAAPPLSAPSGETLVGHTVLVADDAPSVTRYASRVLQSMGATVYIAEDGEQAVDQFRAHADEIDLVLLDMFMPKLNGDEALRRIRQLRPRIKVLIVSGYTEEVYADKFQGEQPTGFLFKPFATFDFMRSIRDALAR